MADVKKKDDATTEEAPAKADTVKVKSNLKALPDGGVPVALWEQDPMHPNGEVYVAGDKTVEVGKTPAVLKAIGAGIISEVK